MDINNTIALLIIALIIAVGVLVLYFGVKKRNRFGINISSLQCPECGQQAPAVRKPKNLSQTLWGGFTCGKCGAEIDKWGKLKNKAHSN